MTRTLIARWQRDGFGTRTDKLSDELVLPADQFNSWLRLACLSGAELISEQQQEGDLVSRRRYLITEGMIIQSRP